VNLSISTLLAITSFAIVALASDRIDRLLTRLKLPMISGFLLVGILAGPYVLRLVSAEAVQQLSFLDDISLAVIAFAAGSELHLKELRSRFKSISWVTASNGIVIPILGSIATFLLADLIPFMQPLSTTGRLAIAILAGAILVARSPSSAIAVVTEETGWHDHHIHWRVYGGNDDLGNRVLLHPNCHQQIHSPDYKGPPLRPSMDV
jgi:Kef-type K+ transport system membrane component KefB